jgi:hypothetical protein
LAEDDVFSRTKMIKLSFRVLAALFVSCVLFISCAANSQQIAAPPLQTKRELAKAVLAEAGIAQRYDLYLGNSIDMAMASPAPSNLNLMAWLKSLVAKEAGWKFAEPTYVTQLEANFSAPELKELLALAKQPLMKKLLQVDFDAYVAAGGERRKQFFQVWDGYNSGQFNVPAEVLNDRSN